MCTASKARFRHRSHAVGAIALFLIGLSMALAQASLAGEIRGTVSSDDSAIPGAMIHAFYSFVTDGQSDPAIQVETVADERGQYFLDIPRAGCWIVRASAEGHVPRYHPGTNDRGDGCVEVAEGDIVESIDFDLDPAGRISGRVTDARSGQPMVGVSVGAWIARTDSLPPPGDASGGGYPDDPFPGEGWALSDENGEYVLDGLGTGDYIVNASSEGHLPEYFDDATAWEQADLVSVVSGETIAGIDFDLSRGGCILGTVTDEGGVPIEGAVVSAWFDGPRDPDVPPMGGTGHSEGDPTDPNGGGGVTGSDGTYSLCGLAPGSYYVQVWAEGYLPELYDDAPSYDEADLVVVESDEDVPGVSFALSRGGQIEGQIRDAASGNPIEGAWVSAWPTSTDSTITNPDGTTGGSGGAAVTDASGRYVLTALASGEYLVVAQASGFLAMFYDGTEDPTEATEVTVTAPGTTASIDIELARGGSIRGVVRDEETGHPVPRAWVEIYLPWVEGPKDSVNSGEFPGQGAVTNEDGEYAIEGLPSGTYLLLASAWEGTYEPEFYLDASTPEAAMPVTVHAPNEIGGIDFTLGRRGSPEGAVSGHVVSDPNGEPLPGAIVFAVSTAGHAGFVTSDVQGFYQIRGLLAGSYYVFAAAAGSIGEFYHDAATWEAATPVDVPVAVSIDFELATEPSGIGTISGRVTHTSGTGVPQAWVYAEPDGRGERGFASTNSEGHYVITGLSPGRYRVLATRLGLESDRYGESPEGAAVEVGSGAIELSDIVLRDALNPPPSSDSTTRLLANVPNPFRGDTAIRFHVDAAPTVVEADIFDVRGALVRHLTMQTSSSGEQSLVWNGRGSNGRALPGGIYAYRLIAGGRVISGRMVLLE